MKKYKNLLYNFILAIYLVIVFIVASIGFSHYLSQGNVDMTAEMSQPTLPVMHLNVNGIKVNYLHGYAEPMECAYMRDSMTVVDSSRRIDYAIDTFGADIASMLFEVRSIDGSRLVESTDIDIYSKNGNEISGYITVKDLITNGNEYMLIFLLNLKDGSCIRYYTRLLWAEDLHVDEKVAFVYDFSDRTFDKEAASEIAKYLESNSSGNNSSFHYTDIHSSFNQVTWGDLDIKRLSEPRITVSELTSATGYFRVEYQVGIQEESARAVCNVTEYFRIRYTSDRIYLLNWERYCNQITDENGSIYVGDQIELGIVKPDIELVESDGGTIFAFVNEGKLISVDTAESRIALLYSFYGQEDVSIRNSNLMHGIHILNVDEAGNVSFMVYGYMDRGVHEGHVGITVYAFNSSTNTIEEKAFINYTKSPSILMENMDELSYIDRDNNVYFMLERNVYEVVSDGESLSVVASSLEDDSYTVSDSGRMLVWQADGDVYSSDRLRLMNLASGISEDIKAGYGEYILPLGFIHEDIVYGLARSREVKTDIDGSIVFPMYKIVIRSAEGEILKEYSEDGIYVMSCRIHDGIMDMERAKYVESRDNYEYVDGDQIVSTEEASGRENSVITAMTESLETVVQISMKQELSADDRINLTPKEIIYEGSRVLDRKEADTTGYYYVYGLHGYMGSYLQASNAINAAYDIAGIVLDNSGEYVWYKTTRVSRNQIMAISEPDRKSAEDSLAICVDAILRFEGITTNSRLLLASGESVQQILRDYMEDDTVLNLNGCNLDAVLYYVNKDIPVLAVMNDATAMLITGFNESQIVVFDPKTGELRKENITDADNMFRANGYKFITYTKN